MADLQSACMRLKIALNLPFEMRCANISNSPSKLQTAKTNVLPNPTQNAVKKITIECTCIAATIAVEILFAGSAAKRLERKACAPPTSEAFF